MSVQMADLGFRAEESSLKVPKFKVLMRAFQRQLFSRLAIPLLCFLSLFAASFLLYREHSNKQRRQLRTFVQKKHLNLFSNLMESINKEQEKLIRVFRNQHDFSEEFDTYPLYNSQFLAFVDKDFELVKFRSENLQSANLGRDFSQSQYHKRFLEGMQGQKLIQSSLLQFTSQGSEFNIFLAIYKEGEFLGTLVQGISLDKIVKSALGAKYRKLYSIQLFEGDTKVFHSGPSIYRSALGSSTDLNFNYSTKNWRLALYPSQMLYEQKVNASKVLLYGFIVSLLLSVVLHLLLTSNMKMSFIKSLAEKLDKEIGMRKDIKREMLQLSIAVEDQIDKRTQSLLNEKSTAYRVMQESIKSKREIEKSDMALRKTHQRLLLALESAGIGIWKWDIQEDRFTMDSFAHKLLGLEYGGFIGSLENFVNLMHYEDQHRVRSEIVDARDKSIDFKSEFRIIQPFGEEVSVAARAKVHNGPQKQPLCMTGILQDLSNEKKTMALMEKFFSLSVDMFCVANRDGYFTHLSPTWLDALGYSFDELYSHPFMFFVHPDDRKRTQAEFQVLISQKHRTINFENRYRCKDGSYRNFLWNAVSLPDEMTIYAIARDITDLKQLEKSFNLPLTSNDGV